MRHLVKSLFIAIFSVLVELRSSQFSELQTFPPASHCLKALKGLHVVVGVKDCLGAEDRRTLSMLGARAHALVSQESIRQLRPFSTYQRHTVQQHGRAPSLQRRSSVALRLRQTHKPRASDTSEALTPAIDQALNGECKSTDLSASHSS